MNAPDAVLTHPHHPSLCGVAKFSQQLAQRLGVPCHFDLGAKAAHPLYSIKGSEGDMSWRPRQGPFSLFAHDATGLVRHLALGASQVYAANAVIADQIRVVRPDVLTAWCPSLIQGNPTRGAFNVLTFGMAHKLQIDQYRKLKVTLDDMAVDYTVSVSTAVHEGSPWDATAKVADQLREVFGARLRVLGYLADDALARELQECSAVALFFDAAVRANNTTYWAALESGKPIFTNYDERSPHESRTWEQLIELIQPEPACVK